MKKLLHLLCIIFINYYLIASQNTELKYTVQFDSGKGLCGVKFLTEENPGSGILLPVAMPSGACVFSGYIFAGWAKVPIEFETSVAPTLFCAETSYFPDDDHTLYAVYRKPSLLDPYSFVQITTLIDFDYNTNYVIVGQHFPSLSTYVLGESAAVNTGYLKADIVTISGSNNNLSLIYNENISIWKFSGDKSGFTISNDSKILYANSNSSMNSILKGGNSSFFILTEVISSDVGGSDNSNRSNRFVFSTNNSMGMIYLNYNNGNARFNNYTSTPNVTMIRALYIFKRVENGIYSSNPACPTLSTITFESGSGICNVAELSEETPGGGIVLPQAFPSEECVLSGYSFAGWATETVEIQTSPLPNFFPAGERYFTEEDITLYAVYKKDQETIHLTYPNCAIYTITVSANENGTINPSENITVNHGGSQRFTFSADAGYEIVQLLVNNVNIPDSIAGKSYTFHKVTTNHTISVIFSLTPPANCPEQVYDAVNNILYNVVRLAERCWIKENLRNTKYQDGRDIPFAKSYSFRGKVEDNDIFGLLYSWYSAVGLPEGSTNGLSIAVQGVCPDGWHLPSQAEWSLLENYTVSLLKSTQYWLDPLGSGSDDSGFTGLPSGWYNDAIDRFQDMHGFAGWWISDAPAGEIANFFGIVYNCNQFLNEKRKRSDGLNVRCVQETNAVSQ